MISEIETPFSFGNNAFGGISSSCVLTIPAGTTSAYTSQGWTTNVFKGGVVEVDNRNEQSLDLASIPAKTYGDAAYTLPTTTTEGLTLTWNSSATNVATISGNILTIEGAGTATITATQSGDDDYKPFSKEFTLTVAKASLTITAKSYTIMEGDALPTFEATYSGFKNDETSAVLTTQPTFTCSATSASAAGTYPITVSGATAANYNISYVTGALTINPLVLLDENSLTPPEAAINVYVSVKRTIKADEWSTIVLPFAMTRAQMEEAFGEDVQLVDFNGIESTKDGTSVTNIMVKFVSATAIEANHPYLIKVSSAISEFTIDGVDIAPVENVSVDCDPIGDDPYRFNSFVGTYVANTEVPDKCLFLNGNKFWYSTGLTKMKAFRGYFNFYDVLAEVNESETKVRFTISGESTDIEGLSPILTEKDTWYTLDGRSLSCKPTTKGIYIVNGKKVIIK